MIVDFDGRCDVCGKMRGNNPKNKNLWNGFHDKDTNKFVCWPCQDKFYKIKKRGPHRGKYSEFPVPFINNHHQE